MTAQAPSAVSTQSAEVLQELNGAPLQHVCLIVLRERGAMCVSELQERVERRTGHLQHRQNIHWAVERLVERRMVRRERSQPRRVQYVATGAWA